MSQSTPLNVAAKPFVPLSNAKLNVDAKPFVPFPELGGEKAGVDGEEQSTEQSSEQSTETSTETTPAASTESVSATPVKAALPASLTAPTRRAGKSAATKVRQVKSATADDDDEVDVKKTAAKTAAAPGTSSAVTAASAERRDDSAITAEGIQNPNGEAWRYDAKFLLSLRDLPVCTVNNAAWMTGFEGLFKPQAQAAFNNPRERDPTRSEAGGGWREAGPAATPALKPGAQLRPGSLRPGATGNTSSVSRLQQQQPQFRQDQGRGSPRGDKQGGDRRNQNNDNSRRRGPDQPMNIEIAPLTKSENRYVVVKEIPPDTKLLRALNAILNKLTPEKFDTLLAQVLELKITNVGLLRDCVTAVFEKALAEPNFSPMYAEFCVKLSSALPTFEDQQGETNFRKLILNRCQTEFTDPIHALPADQMAAMSDMDRNDHVAMAKRRKLGTIRFIGELYVRSMIASKILRECINMLFGSQEQPVEEEIEALCKLLETTGKALATSKAKDAALNTEHLNTTMQRLNTMKDTPGLLSSRIRFMIADVNDMQSRGWVSRKHVEQAKKISDLHAEQQANEAQAALQQMYQNLNQPSQPVKHKMSRVSDRYALPSTPAKPVTAPGDWSTVTRGPSGKKIPQNQASSPRHAIPMSALSGTTTESNGAANAFALLHREREEEHRHEEEEPVHISAPKSSSKKEMTEEEKLDKLDGVLSDYFQSLDINDADLTVEERHLAPIPATFIENSISRVVEAKEKERLGLVTVLAKFHERDYLVPQTIIDGLISMISRIDDLQIDVPACDQHIALIIGQLAVKNVIGLEWLTADVLEQTGSAASGLKFITSLLASIKTKGDEETLQTVVKSAQSKGWSLQSVLSASQADVKKYLTDKKLDSLISLL